MRGGAGRRKAGRVSFKLRSSILTYLNLPIHLISNRELSFQPSLLQSASA
jgi:hypothetical protein